VNPRGASTLSREVHIHVRPQLTARFRASTHACAGPKAAAVDDEGVRLPGELVRAQHAVVLLPDPCHTACGKLTLRPRPV
jgi:hypothetical protein